MGGKLAIHWPWFGRSLALQDAEVVSLPRFGLDVLPVDRGPHGISVGDVARHDDLHGIGGHVACRDRGARDHRALLVHAGAHLNNGQPFPPEQVEMVYWFAEYPNEPARFPYTSAQYKRDWDTLVKLADEIHGASSYPLTDDRAKCFYCPYRSYCDRGVRAGDLEQAEAETEAEELFDVNFEQIGEIAF